MEEFWKSGDEYLRLSLFQELVHAAELLHTRSASSDLNQNPIFLLRSQTPSARKPQSLHFKREHFSRVVHVVTRGCAPEV